MNEHHHNARFPDNQRGVALAVSLVLLLVLSVVAITASNVSRMQEKISGNTQQERTTFQAGFSALNAKIEEFKTDPEDLKDAIDDGTKNLSLDSGAKTAVLDNANVNLDTFRATHMAQGCPYKFSCDHFEGHFFELDARTSISNTGAVTDQTQGALRVTPRP